MNMRYLWAGAVASLLPLYFLIVRVPWRWARMQAYHRPVQGPAGQRFPHHPVDDRRQHGRPDGPGPDGGQAEAFLSARAAYRFHFCRDRQELGLWGSLLVSRFSASFSIVASARPCGPTNVRHSLPPA